MAEHHDSMPWGWFVITGRQRPSHGGADAEHREKVAGHERAKDGPAVNTAIDIGYLSEHIGEDVRLTTERLELSAGEGRTHAVCAARPLNRVHLLDVWHLIDVKQEHVEERERNRHQAEAEGHSGDDGGRNQGSTLESTDCIEDVSDEVVRHEVGSDA